VNTTADGIIAALQVLQTINSTGKSLHELKQAITKFPHEVKSIPHNGTTIDLEDPAFTTLLANAKHKLGPHGRINVRYSGTEPLIRLMVEGESHHLVDEIRNELEHSIIDSLNNHKK
jgi:phosphoglucosamine mutase